MTELKEVVNVVREISEKVEEGKELVSGIKELNDIKDIKIVVEEQKENLSLSDYLLKKLSTNEYTKELTDKLSFKINDQTINILKTILAKSPSGLNKVTENVKDILKDGTIDTKDIPKLLLLVTNLYKTDFQNIVNNLNLTSKDIIEFIKSLIKLIIDLDYVKVNNKPDTFELVDISGEILELVIPSQEVNTSSCFLWLTKCFKGN